MAHFKIDYISSDDNSLKSVVVYADYGSEAVSNAVDDYPDIKEITKITMI